MLFGLGSVVVGVTAVMLTNYHSYATRYVRHFRSFYERPRWRWMHPTSERHDRIGLRVASALGLAMGIFILVAEISALASGHVS